jgi:hypothetical protein
MVEAPVAIIHKIKKRTISKRACFVHKASSVHSMSNTPTNNSLCTVPYGNLKVPFSDPMWYRGAISPYYRDSHAILRDKVRQFCEKEIRPFADEWEEKEDYPREIHETAYKAGIFGYDCEDALIEPINRKVVY